MFSIFLLCSYLPRGDIGGILYILHMILILSIYWQYLPISPSKSTMRDKTGDYANAEVPCRYLSI